MIGKLGSHWLTKEDSTQWKFVKRLLECNQLTNWGHTDLIWWRSNSHSNIPHVLWITFYLCGCFSRRILMRVITFKKTRRYVSRNIHSACMFLQRFPLLQKRKHCFHRQFCFQYANYTFTIWQIILTRIRACVHSSNFCKGQFCKHF